MALRKLVLQTIGQEAKKRKQLIMDVINKYGYGKEELKDTGSDVCPQDSKSFTGIVITALEEKALLMTDDFKIVSASLPDKEILEIFLKISYRRRTEGQFPSGKKISSKLCWDLIKRKRSNMKAIDVVAYLDGAQKRNRIQ